MQPPTPTPIDARDKEDLVALFFDLFRLVADAQTLVDSLMPRLPRTSNAEVREAFKNAQLRMTDLSRSASTAKPIPVLLADAQALSEAARALFTLTHKSRLDYYANLGIDLLNLVCERLMRTTELLMNSSGEKFTEATKPLVPPSLPVVDSAPGSR